MTWCFVGQGSGAGARQRARRRPGCPRAGAGWPRHSSRARRPGVCGPVAPLPLQREAAAIAWCPQAGVLAPGRSVACPDPRRVRDRRPGATRSHGEQVPFSRAISTVLAANKYRSRGEQVPFSRRTSTVLATNKYRSRDEQVPFSRRTSTVLASGGWEVAGDVVALGHGNRTRHRRHLGDRA